MAKALRRGWPGAEGAGAPNGWPAAAGAAGAVAGSSAALALRTFHTVQRYVTLAALRQV